MADTKISGLPAVSAAVASHELAVNEAGVSKKVTMAQIGEFAMKRVKHLFTASELLNLRASPITLLSSPGPNNRYATVAMFAYYKFVTTPYTLNGNTEIQFPNTTAELVITLPFLLDAAADRIQDRSASSRNSQGVSNFNAPLSLTVDGASELLSGDGTLLVVIYYTIESNT